MRVVEVNPYDYRTSEMDADGYWHEEDTLPVDEWKCSTCSAPIGWQLHETPFATNLGWTQVWTPVGSDPRPDDATRLCEDCTQDHEEVEV